MSDQFLSEIRTFSFKFPPSGWALCDGAALLINQNQALFSLLGTTFGGNGVTTFKLPTCGGVCHCMWAPACPLVSRAAKPPMHSLSTKHRSTSMRRRGPNCKVTPSHQRML